MDPETPDVAESQAAEPPVTAAAGTTVAPAADGRPDDIPEPFWDAEKRTPRVDAILKSWKDTRAQNQKLSEQWKPAEEIDWSMPEGYDESVRFIDPNCPMAVALAEALPEAKFTPAQIDQLKRVWFNGQQKVADIERGRLVEEAGGDEASVNERLAALAGQINAAFGGEENKRMAQMARQIASTAEGVKILEAAFSGDLQRQHGTETPFPSPNDTTTAGPITEASLRSTMMSDAYQRGDPETVKRVREGFQRLYPQRVRTAVTGGGEQVGDVV